MFGFRLPSLISNDGEHIQDKEPRDISVALSDHDTALQSRQEMGRRNGVGYKTTAIVALSKHTNWFYS